MGHASYRIILYLPLPRSVDALRDKLRCRELWVAGADKYRNPDDDLQKDFEVKREQYYEALVLQLELCGRIWKGERKQSKKVS